MWISAAVATLIAFVLLEPVEEVEAGHSRLVIHTPQRVKVIHRYHTSEHYAKDYGYGGDYRYKPRKPRRGKKGRGRRGRYRKGHIRKIGRRTPFTGRKSYGMYNYARNYRNWVPQRRPHTRYRDSYLPITYGQEDDGNHADSDNQEDYDSNNDSTSFGNEIQAIDYYARRNRDDRRDHSKSSTWNQDSRHDSVSRNSYQPDNTSVRSRVQGYSTLPDEVINAHSSSGDHDFVYSSATGQEFGIFKKQNLEDSQQFRLFKNQSPGAGQDFRVFKTQDPGNGQEFRVSVNHNPLGIQEFRLKNNKFREGEEFRFKNQNSGNREETRQNVQNYPAVQETQIDSHKFGSGQTSAGTQDSRYNNQNFRGTHEFQYTTQTPHSGQESRLKIQNFGGVQDLRYNTHNSAGRYVNQNSASGVQSSEPHFSAIPGKADNNRPHRETEHTAAGGVDTPRANSEDLYYKAFRSFSFRKNPTHSSSKGGQTGSFSGSSFSDEGISHSASPPFHSGVEHSDGHNYQWFNNRKRPNKDHDIGFFEGLEDINDRTGI